MSLPLPAPPQGLPSQDWPVVVSPLSWWCPHWGWRCQVPQVLGPPVGMSLAPRAAGLSRPGRGLSYPFFSPPSWGRPCWVLASMWWPVVTQSCPCSPRAGPQGAGDGSHPCTATGSLSWPLAAVMSQDVALLGAWRPARCYPCAEFVTKAWHGHHRLSRHPRRLLARPMLCPSLPWAVPCPCQKPIFTSPCLLWPC